MNSPHTEGAEPAIDADVLERLEQLDPGGRNGLVPRVLRTYRGSLERARVEIRVARHNTDLAALQRLAHTLKSSSASVGAMAFAAVCADVERRIREQAPEDLSSLLDRLQAEAERVHAAVDAMLPRA